MRSENLWLFSLSSSIKLKSQWFPDFKLVHNFIVWLLCVYIALWLCKGSSWNCGSRGCAHNICCELQSIGEEAIRLSSNCEEKKMVLKLLCSLKNCKDCRNLVMTRSWSYTVGLFQSACCFESLTSPTMEWLSLRTCLWTFLQPLYWLVRGWRVGMIIASLRFFPVLNSISLCQIMSVLELCFALTWPTGLMWHNFFIV